MLIHNDKSRNATYTHYENNKLYHLLTETNRGNENGRRKSNENVVMLGTDKKGWSLYDR